MATPDPGPTVRDGEIGVTARLGGRLITLDPIMDREPIDLHVRRVESIIPCGLRSQWLSGTANDPDSPMESFEMDAGAGLGSRYLTLTVHMKDGTVIQECVDMTALARLWVDTAIAAGPSPEVGTDG
jgi:hypothetical protein